MIITSDFFVGSVFLSESITNTPIGGVVSGNNKLQSFIEEYEAEALKKCLGLTLYKAFSGQIENNTVKANADQKWKDLFNGKTYQVGGAEAYWQGLVFTSENLKQSLLAYYIYSHFILDDNVTAMGVVKESPKNGVNIDPHPKAVRAYRKFYDLAIGSFSMPTIIRNSFGLGIDYSSVNSGTKSLYQFLNDNKATYPEWQPTYFENQNQMGL